MLEGGESLCAVDIIPELWSTRQVLACSPWSQCGHPVVLEGKIVASHISLFLVLIPASSSHISGQHDKRLLLLTTPSKSPYS